MPMDLHGNYVYPGLSYPSYTQPLPNVMAQPTAQYHNPHMLYYPATNPVYTGMTPVCPPSDLYSSPTFLSHLKAIADNILASDARTRKRGAKSKISTKLTPLVRRPATETLDELRSSAYYRYKQMAPTTMIPVEYPNTDTSGISTPAEVVTIPSDTDEEYIDVEDIEDDGDDITSLAPPPIADSPYIGKDLGNKTENGLPKFVATFNEEPRYTVTSASTHLLLIKSNSLATTLPLSDTETERNNDEYPRSSFTAFSKRNESYAQLFGQGIQKSLDDTGKMNEMKTEQRPLPDFSSEVSMHIDQPVYINGTSSVVLDNAIFPDRPPSEPLRLRTPSEFYDEGLTQNKERPIRPRSEPAILYDKTWIYPRKPKQMRTDNLACTLESKIVRVNPGASVQRKMLPHAIEALVDCGIKIPRPEYPIISKKHVALVAERQLLTGKPPSYARQTSFAHGLPQPSVGLGTTAPSAKESLHPASSLATYPTETLNRSSSYANSTPSTPEIPQPSPDTSTTAVTKAWPWFGLPSVSELMSFTPQVAPYATGAEAGTTPSSLPYESPQPTATSTSAWPWTAPTYEEVPAKPAESFKTQFATGTDPSYASGASLAYADPQANAELGTRAAAPTAWTWQWNAHPSVSPHVQSTATGANPSPINLAYRTGGKGWGVSAELLATQLRPMQSATESSNHNVTPNSQVSTPDRVKLEQTLGLPSNGFSGANHKTQLLGKKPNAKRKFGSPKIEVSPKHPRARKPARVSSQPPKQRRVFPDEAQNTSQMQRPIFTSIGARGTLVRRDFYDIIAWDDYVQCTKLLMQFIFNFRSLATLTLDGSDRLDADIVHDIATHVSVKCGIPVEQVHHTMRHVCSVARKCFEESNRS